MKLVSREFLRALRCRALFLLRQDENLWRDYKRQRQRLELIVNREALAGGLWIFVLILSFVVFGHNNTAAIPAAVALYCTATIILRASSLQKKLHGPGELSIFMALPISDLDFFGLQWKKFVCRSSGVMVLATSMYLTTVVTSQAHVPSGRAIIAAIIAGFLQWILVCCLVVLTLKAGRPALVYVAFGLNGLLFFGIFFPAAVAHQLHEFTYVLPAGWINLLYESAVAGKMAGLLWAIPALALAAASFSRLGTIRDAYSPLGQEANRLHEDLLREKSVPDCANAGTSSSEAAAEKTQEQSVLDLARDRLATHGLGLDPDWNARGWIEKIAARWLTRNERAVADFMLGEYLAPWSANWTKALLITLAIIALAGLAPFVSPWLYGAGVVLAGALAAPLLGGRWIGFAPVVISLRQSSVLAFYPVSYWQVSRVILKINLVRLLAWFVLLSPAIVVIGWRLGFGISDSFGLSLIIFFLVAVGQLGALVLLHSKSTNDTMMFSLPGLPFLLSVLGCLFAALLAIFLFFLPLPHGQLLGGLIFTPALVVAWLSYGLLYNRGRIDLMRNPDGR